MAKPVAAKAKMRPVVRALLASGARLVRLPGGVIRIGPLTFTTRRPPEDAER